MLISVRQAACSGFSDGFPPPSPATTPPRQTTPFRRLRHFPVFPRTPHSQTIRGEAHANDVKGLLAAPNQHAARQRTKRREFDDSRSRPRLRCSVGVKDNNFGNENHFRVSHKNTRPTQKQKRPTETLDPHKNH